MPYVSSNKAITERDIYKKILNFNYTNLSSNPNLPAKFVNDNLNGFTRWNMHLVSANPNITPTDIESYHNIFWDYEGFSLNKNINIDYVLSKKDKPWSVSFLLTNSAITLNNIYDNLDYFDIIDKEKYICSNSNITVEWVDKNIRFIDWNRLSLNNLL
jgi:hypothetical protein